MKNAQPPQAQKREHRLNIHGDERLDDYFWLRERTNEEVLNYLREENAYVESKMAPTSEFQQKLVEEMKAKIKKDDQTLPVQKGNYLYYLRWEEKAEYPIYCRKKIDRLEEEVILNANTLAEGQNYFQLGQVQASPDHRLLAYSVDTVGRRIYQVFVKDLDTGKLLDVELENTSGNLTWAADNRHLFYTRLEPETLRSFQVYRKDIFDSEPEVLVMEEEDEAFDLWVSRSKRDTLLFIDSTSTLSSEIYFAPADQPKTNFVSFHPREAKHEYDIVDGGDRFFIYTNWLATNFRIMEAPLRPTRKEEWKEYIAHRPDTLIEDFEVFENYLAIEERNSGLPRIQIVNRSNGSHKFIEYDDPTYVASLGDNPQYSTDKLRYEYESLNTPESIFEIEMESGEKTLLKQKEVPGGFDSNLYRSERVFAPAQDGTLIPISLLYRIDKRKGSQPLLLYGYGSYGINSEPYFSSERLSLVDRGFIYAIAHVRGGSEMGREWYENGKLLKKMNSFTDFIACAEHLIRESYTSAEKLYATGGSAGGLLMGGVVNMRPDLFKAVVARVPFVDVLTTMLDESIPLTTFEYDEWGNPNDEEYYRYMRSYSPYDNIKKQSYPHLLVTTGLHDSQVQYWEPAKWVAKLRMNNTGNNLLLFRTEMHAGHGGKSGRFESLKETALVYAFFIGIEEGLLK